MSSAPRNEGNPKPWPLKLWTVGVSPSSQHVLFCPARVRAVLSVQSLYGVMNKSRGVANLGMHCKYVALLALYEQKCKL